MATLAFNDQIYLQTALSAFVNTLTPLGAFASNFSGQTAQKGNVILVPRVESVATTTFSYSNNSGFPYEQSGGVQSCITVNLDQNFYSTVELTDQQVANSTAANINHFAEVQGRTLGEVVLGKIWNNFTTANYGAAILNTAVTNYTRAGTVSIRGIMVKTRKVPIEECSLIVNEDVMGNLLNDANINQAYSYGGSEAIREGNIPMISGMKLYHTNIMPANGITLQGVVAHPNAVAVAMRYLEPQVPGNYVVARKMEDPSGIVAGMRQHYNPAKGTYYMNMEVLFGSAVGISTGLGLLTSP